MLKHTTSFSVKELELSFNLASHGYLSHVHDQLFIQIRGQSYIQVFITELAMELGKGITVQSGLSGCGFLFFKGGVAQCRV